MPIWPTRFSIIHVSITNITVSIIDPMRPLYIRGNEDKEKGGSH